MIAPFTKRDFDAAYADFERFWPGRPGLRALLHPIYLDQFGETAYAICEGDELVAYLRGFLTPVQPPEGYIHMVAVREDRRGRGLARGSTITSRGRPADGAPPACGPSRRRATPGRSPFTAPWASSRWPGMPGRARCLWLPTMRDRDSTG